MKVKALPVNSYAAEFRVKGRDDLRGPDILNVPSVLNSTLKRKRERRKKGFAKPHRENISAVNCWTAQGNAIRQSKLNKPNPAAACGSARALTKRPGGLGPLPAPPKPWRRAICLLGGAGMDTLKAKRPF